jgi:hypothetical protein
LKPVNIKLYKQEEAEINVSKTRDERVSFWAKMQRHPKNIPVE